MQTEIYDFSLLLLNTLGHGYEETVKVSRRPEVSSGCSCRIKKFQRRDGQKMLFLLVRCAMP